MSQLRHQLDMDAARLRKAADRIDEMLGYVCELEQDRTVAVQSLKIISTWAACLRHDKSDTDANQIRARALDALRLMGEKVCE